MLNLRTAALATALILSAGNVLAAPAPALKIGEVLPADVSFTDHLGKTRTFGEFRGKPLVLEWTNPGCPFVQKFYNAGAMQKQQAATVAQGVNWLAINSSAKGQEGYVDATTASAAVAKSGMKGTAYILDGADGSKLGRMFGAKTTPHMFVADKEGKLVYAGAIDSIPSFSASDIDKAENYVKAAVDATLAGQAVPAAETRAYGCSVKY